MFESVDHIAESDCRDFKVYPQVLASYINENGGEQKILAQSAL